MNPADLAYLRTPAAIRERAGQVLKYVEDGRSAWWMLDANGLEAAVQATLAVTLQRFPNPAAIPFHSRWRHFEAGAHDRDFLHLAHSCFPTCDSRMRRI